jgi:hypothetical protein
MKKYQFQLPAIPFYVPAFIDRIAVTIVLRYRKIRYGCAFRRIKLTKDKPAGQKPVEARYAIVDAEDYPKLAENDWQYYENKSKNCYAVRMEVRKIVYMHRVIMNATGGYYVDHRNQHGLDNRRANLRLATPAENTHNKRKTRSPVTSKYKGVSLRKNENKWIAHIDYQGRRIHLGSFKNEEEAANAYDEAAKKYFKEFASLNFEDDSYPDEKA